MYNRVQCAVVDVVTVVAVAAAGHTQGIQHPERHSS